MRHVSQPKIAYHWTQKDKGKRSSEVFLGQEPSLFPDDTTNCLLSLASFTVKNGPDYPNALSSCNAVISSH